MREKDHDSQNWLDPWVDQFSDSLVAYAYVLTQDYHAAQDVTQETFVRLYTFCRRHPDRDIVPGWLYTTLRRQVLTTLRRRREWVDLDAGHMAVSDTPVWLPALFRDTLLKLPRADRECLWLFYYNDWTTEQIARHLGLSPGAVRGRLMRARQRLRAMWEAD